ncbi:MAG: ABC transporter transmembrane domain-containing protein, partial [Nanoarchaeota archaeon]
MGRYDKIDFKYNFKVFWSFLSRYKSLVFLLLFLSFILQSFTVIDKFLLKILIDNGTGFVSGNLVKNKFIQTLISLALAYGLIIILKPIGKWFHLHIINILQSKLIVDLKRDYFNHIVHLSHRFHTTHKTGSLISRLLRGGSAIERMTDVLAFNVAPLIFELVVVAFSVIYFDLNSAIVVFITAVVFVFYSLIMQKMQKMPSIRENEAEDIEKANVSDIFTNIDSIKYFGKEENIKVRYKALSEKTKKA